jgi:hypothetical protein
MPLPGIYASSMRVGGPSGAYDALASVTLSATAPTVVFAGVPNSYKHLQIRVMARSGRANSGGGDWLSVRFNGDTSSSYSYHELYGNGSSAGTQAAASQTYGFTERIADAGATTGLFGVIVMDILDANSTAKNKTLRYLGGYDMNGSLGSVMLGSCAWYNTTAISSITLASLNGDLQVGSSFALYGVK